MARVAAGRVPIEVCAVGDASLSIGQLAQVAADIGPLGSLPSALIDAREVARRTPPALEADVHRVIAGQRLDVGMTGTSLRASRQDDMGAAVPQLPVVV